MDYGTLQAVEGGVDVLNSIVNATAEINQSDFISKQFQFNEHIAEIQSREAITQGRVEQQISQERTAQLHGEQVAAEAAQGVDVNSGTPAITRQQTAEIGGIDYLTLGNNAAMKALGFKIQGENAATQAGLETSAGFNKAGDTLLGGAEQLFQTQLKAIDYENFPTGPTSGSEPSQQELESSSWLLGQPNQ